MTKHIPRSEVAAKLRELADNLLTQMRTEYETSCRFAAEDMLETLAYEHGKSVARGQCADAARALANVIELDVATMTPERVDLHGQTVTQRVSVRIWIEGDDGNTVGGTMSTTEGPVRLAAFFASTWRRALQRFGVSP